MSLISLDASDSRPLVEQIVQGLRQRIEIRNLRIGTRLPSIRVFAKEHGVSRFTVVQAYDRLVAEGYLQSRKGSGFYVTNPAINYYEQENTQVKTGLKQLDLAIDELWLLRQSLDNPQPPRFLPGCGWLPAAWLKDTGLHKALRSLARLPYAQLTNYGQAAGFLPLRRDLQKRLADIGIFAEIHQVITTHGISQAVDMICRLLLKTGDVVLVDDPGYFNLFGYLKLQGIEFIGIPRHLDGPDITTMENLIKTYQPKAYFTNNLLHNPTGTCIKQSIAYRILQLAEKHNVWIIEDDVLGDLHDTNVTRLATLDQLNRVIYMSSFSKTISSAVRVGYVACRADLAQALLDIKLLTQVSSAELSEQLVHQILVEGHYRKHLEKLRSRLQSAREYTLTQLEKINFECFYEAEQGLFLWAKLKGSEANSANLVNHAARQSIMLAPGNIFRPHHEPSPWLRFNVAFCDAPEIFAFFDQIN